MKRFSLRALLPAIAAAAVVAWPAGAALPGATVVLQRDVVHHLSAATLVGPVDASKPITVGVFLSNPNQAAEDAYLKSVYDPSSPSHGRYLAPAAFNQAYGVSASTLQATESWLRSGGLKTTEVPGATNYVLASGTAAQMQSAFGTAINEYKAGAKSFYANAVAPSVPSSLGVSTVLGLNDFNRFTTAAGGVPQTGLLTPQQLWSIYDQPSTNLGDAETMAIFGWGTTDGVVNDLRAFESEFALPQAPVTVQYYGATDTPDTSGDGATVEWELDTQASTGMAPNVQSETLYFGHHNTDADILAAITAWANDANGPKQGSASFGECENVPAAEPVIGVDGLQGPGDAILEQAVIEGRTLFVSTGDTGSSCPVVPVSTNGVATQAYPALNYPSASPYAVAVGGTVLNSDGGNPPKRLTETAWEYTGGGNSISEPAAAYQSGVAPLHCATDASGTPYLPGQGPLCRATPDVASLSGDVATGNGMNITDDNGTDQQGAGTSLSSPLWLGMWTRIQAAAPDAAGLGFANYKLYAAGASANYSRDFFDVTVGNNQPYAATPGWDNVSGWGTPDVANLMTDLAGRVTPRNAIGAPVPAASTPTVTCGSLFTDVAGDDQYVVEGQTLGAKGAQPQFDVLGGQFALSADGSTLRTIITVRNLSTTIPTGGVENDYNVVWSLNGVQYFTQLAVEAGGIVAAYDGQVVHASLETRYQQLHTDTGILTPGPNGTVEVDVPLANIGSPTIGEQLVGPVASSNVREGAAAGPLEPIDSAGPSADYVLDHC
jgi:subtilase family serine protease